MMFYLSCAVGTGVVGALLLIFAHKARENESGAAKSLAAVGGICLLLTVGFLACVVVFTLAVLNGWWTVSQV